MNEVKIIKPQQGVTFFYQPIYKKFKNNKFKDISILEKYQYDFLDNISLDIFTECWLKLKFTTHSIILDSIYNSNTKKYSNNVEGFLNERLSYYDVLYCGEPKDTYSFEQPFCIITETTKTMVGYIDVQYNDLTQLYLRSIVEFLEELPFNDIEIPNQSNEDVRWIILIEFLYNEFKNSIYNFNFKGDTYNFNFKVIENHILNESDNNLNYRIFFNFLTNYKLSWKGNLYNEEFKNSYFTIKQKLNYIKYDY